MPTTRRACRAALFQSIGDDVLTHVLATMTSFADRSAINSVCKRWTKIVASRAFAQARREVGETGLVLVGYPWCPSGCLDGRYVVFDQKNTIQVLNDYNTWTPLVTLPGTFEHPAMASRVPLI